MTYSSDLKIRLINVYTIYKGKMFNNDKITFRKLSIIFNVSKSTIHRWLSNIILPININKQNSKLVNTHKNITVLNFLKRSLDHNPFQNLNVLNIKVFKKFNISLSKKTISNYIKLIGYSKKKLTRRLYNTKNLKDHLDYRKQKLKEIQKIKIDDLICLDECSINRDTHLQYGYCNKKKRLIKFVKYKNLLGNHSIIMTINKDGVLYYEIYKKAINTDIFYTFLEKLLPKIKKKYILMDNIPFHKSKRIIKLIKDSGNYPLYIPPYSPDFNPIEEVFSKLKSFIRNKITPVTTNKNVSKLLYKFSKTITTFKMYYEHAFNK